MKKDINSFFVAERKNGILAITCSLVATIIGASSGIGIAGKFYNIGLPAIWWLLSGAIGLLILGFFFIKKIEIKKFFTLPELLGEKFGTEVRFLSAICICLSWLAIIAAQILAGGLLVNYFFPSINIFIAYFIILLIFISYSFFSGQKAVIKTDIIQFFFFLFTYFILFIFAFNKKIFFTNLINIPFNIVNEKFNYSDTIKMLLIVGFPYIIGPDIYSRIFSANSLKTAKYSIILSAIIILFIAFLIYFIVEFNKTNILSIKHSDMILYEITNNIIKNFYLKIFIIFGFLSLLISSADTCLLSSSIICVNDILKIIFKQKNFSSEQIVFYSRIFILIFGFLSLLVTFFSKFIIDNLLFAYTIYTTTICLPIFFTFVFDKIKYSKKIIIFVIISSMIILIFLKFVVNYKSGNLLAFLFSFLVLLIYSILWKKKFLLTN